MMWTQPVGRTTKRGNHPDHRQKDRRKRPSRSQVAEPISATVRFFAPRKSKAANPPCRSSGLRFGGVGRSRLSPAANCNRHRQVLRATPNVARSRNAFRLAGCGGGAKLHLRRRQAGAIGLRASEKARLRLRQPRRARDSFIPGPCPTIQRHSRHPAQSP